MSWFLSISPDKFKVNISITPRPLHSKSFTILLSWLTTATIRFVPRSVHVGFVVDNVALRVVFLRTLRFPLPILIPLPPAAPQSLIMLYSLDAESVVKQPA
jgi:hypothetical protein